MVQGETGQGRVGSAHMKHDEPPRDLLDWLALRRYPDWRVARPLGMLLGMAAVVLLALALIAAFATVIRAIGGGASSAGGNLGAGALIVALLGAPFLIWGTLIKHRTLSAQMDGQITDRIAKAVEQLGAEKTVKEPNENGAVAERTRPNIEVRIGAILSLERIAQDSTSHDHGRDHARVMEILCAYLRENAPASAAQDHPYGEWQPLKDNPTEAERAAHLAMREERLGSKGKPGLIGQWAKTLPPPRADVAIALQVIGRRSADQRRVEAAWPAPPSDQTRWLFDTDAPTPPLPEGDAAIPQAQIDNYLANLRNWQEHIRAYPGYRLDLRQTNLHQADLSRAVLAGARLEGARLEGANLNEARLEGAKLQGAQLEGARLWLARLQGANLGWARLGGASLQEARLEGANLWQARLEAANLKGARLEGANLWQARLEGAVLRAARLEGADLRVARLDGANLSEARLEGANLEWARLEGAALWDVDCSRLVISQQQIDAAFGDGSVILPAPLTRPDHWPPQKLDGETFFSEWHKWQASPAAYTPPPPPAP